MGDAGRRGVQLQRQCIALLPGILRQQRQPRVEIVQCGIKGGRFAGTQAGTQVKPCQPHTLCRSVEQTAGLGKMIADLESTAVDLVRSQTTFQLAADLQVQGFQLIGVDQRIGRLLYPVVDETVTGAPGVKILEQPVAFILWHDQAFGQRRPEVIGGLARLQSADHHQCAQVEAAADTGGQGQHRLGLRRQALDFVHHQFDDVVGHLLRADRPLIPLPALFTETDQTILMQGVQKLTQKKRVALSLFAAGFGQCSAFIRVRSQSIGNELVDLIRCQWLQCQLHRRQGRVVQAFQTGAQRVSGTQFMVAIAADQQQPWRIGHAGQGFDQVQGGEVGPVQIIQKQHQWALGRGKDAQHLDENTRKSVLFFGRGKGRGIGLITDDQLQLGDQAQQNTGVTADTVQQLFTPACNANFRLGEELAYQALQGLENGEVGTIASELIKLAAAEATSLLVNVLAQLMHQTGFAHACIAGDQDQRALPFTTTVVQLMQLLQNVLTAIESLWNLEPG